MFMFFQFSVFPFFHFPIYSERLKKLDLPTLLHRRERGDKVQVWKHFRSYDLSTLSSNFKHNPRPNRRHGLQLTWNKPKDGSRGLQANSFYFRTAATWNNLPANIVDAPCINTFKSRLDKAWNDHPTKFSIEQEPEMQIDS